jgi:hypothetical protein
VNVFLYDGAIVPDPHGIVTGGHDNTTAARSPFAKAKNQRARPERQVKADHREQSNRWLKKTEASCEVSLVSDNGTVHAQISDSCRRTR